jgi:L-alanine-DL-glutamate epimerase-like enolase superfamily enzyme
MDQVTTTISTRRIELERPQLTPRGTFAAVWSTDLSLEVHGTVSVGRARSMDEARATEAADALTRLCADREVQGALDALVSSDSPLDLWRRTWLELEGRSAPGAPLKALCALDEAVWALAREQGWQPATASPQSSIGVYWSGLWQHSTPEELAAEVRWAADQGYDAAKMRVDGHAPGLSIDRIRAALAAAPSGRWLALELAHSGTPDAVAEMVGAIDASRVLWVEDPLAVGEVRATAELVTHLPVAVALGEDCWGRGALAELVAASGAQMPIIDLGYLGGPTAMWSILRDGAFGRAELGVHIDALTGADVAATTSWPGRVWLEAYAWWGLPDLAELRRRAHRLIA